MCSFDKYKPATLNKSELSFFDEQLNNIVKEVLPALGSTAEKERSDRLKHQDAVAQANNKKVSDATVEVDAEDKLYIELRRSIKTVEVMGLILKNRFGSLETPRLESIFLEAMNVHLRILTSFFELIKQGNEQKIAVDFIADKLNKTVQKEAEQRKKEGKKEREPDKKELEDISKKIFWNMNFFVVYGLIDKIIHSLGSDKLIAVSRKVCDDINTPVSFLVKHGILMWYNKNMQIDVMADTINAKENPFSDIAKKVMNFLIVNHCAIHVVGYQERQKVEVKFKIPCQTVIPKGTLR